MKLKINETGIAILFVITNIFFFFLCFQNQNIWYDETYSMSLTSHSFADIWSITASDVHPPLYYFICKILFLLFGSNLAIARFVSFVPFLLLLLFGFTKIRTYFGTSTMLYYTLLCCSIPVMLKYELEARMYLLAALFVFSAALSAYEIFNQNTKKSWLVLTLCSIGAAYTHYYALLAIVLVYLLLLCSCLMHKRQRFLFPFICSVVIDICAYLPWLGNLLSQIKTVKNDYWIAKPGITDIIKYLVFPFAVVKQLLPSAIAAILAAILFLLAGKAVFTMQDKQKKTLILLCLLIPVGIFVIGLSVSYLVKPVLVARYFFVSYPLIWLAVSLALSEYKNDRIRYFIIFICAMLMLVEGCFQFREEHDNGASEFSAYCEKLQDENCVFLARSTHELGVLWYYLPDEPVYMLESSEQKQLEAFMPELTYINSIDTLSSDHTCFIVCRKSLKLPKELKKSHDFSLEKEITVEGTTYCFYKLQN